MTRTTPPRPLDVAAQFPELAPLARTTVRLHPRAGSPTAADSSVGGPLLWPADEPWPVCPDHGEPWQRGRVPEEIRRRRGILAEAWSRPRRAGTDPLTPGERAVVDRAAEDRRVPVEGPSPLIPVAQLYASDVPGLPRPEGTDLLQVLWCPFDHVGDYLPRTELRWRAAADVGSLLADVPQPPVVGNDDYLPEPCVLHPEPVTEYPAPHELPPDLADRVRSWSGLRAVDHQGDLGVAPGCKVGGHAPWSFSDPYPVRCTECGGEVRPLLTLAGHEWDDGSASWRPAEESGTAAAQDTHLTIGRGYSLQLYVCAASYGHPHVQNMQ